MSNQSSEATNRRRRARRDRRLGPDARCARCGCTDRRVLELHHIGGRKNDPKSVVVYCRNCHAIVEEKQRDFDAPFAIPRDILDKDFAVRRHQAALLQSIVDIILEDAPRLAAFYAALDERYPEWRTIPEAAL